MVPLALESTLCYTDIRDHKCTTPRKQEWYLQLYSQLTNIDMKGWQMSHTQKTRMVTLAVQSTH